MEPLTAQNILALIHLSIICPTTPYQAIERKGGVFGFDTKTFPVATWEI